VADLASAARELETAHGLASVEGGRHPGWGTANRIVPLGGTYLELIAVVDASEAELTPFGRWVAASSPATTRPLGWAVRTDRLDDVTQRLGVAVGAGTRVDASGRLLTWRLAGVEQAVAEPSLPFFIEWGRETPFPGRARRVPDLGRRHQCPRLCRPLYGVEGGAERAVADLCCGNELDPGARQSVQSGPNPYGHARHGDAW